MEAIFIFFIIFMFVLNMIIKMNKKSQGEESGTSKGTIQSKIQDFLEQIENYEEGEDDDEDDEDYYDEDDEDDEDYVKTSHTPPPIVKTNAPPPPLPVKNDIPAFKEREFKKSEEVENDVYKETSVPERDDHYVIKNKVVKHVDLNNIKRGILWSEILSKPIGLREE